MKEVMYVTNDAKPYEWIRDSLQSIDRHNLIMHYHSTGMLTDEEFFKVLSEPTRNQLATAYTFLKERYSKENSDETNV
jgi:hypothetical protein